MAGRVRSWGVLLFKKAFWAGLESGAITLTFRRWQSAHVKPGGRYRCHPIGVIEVDAIERVAAGAIPDHEASAAGFASRAQLIEHLRELGPLDDATLVYRVAMHHAGDGDRVAIAMQAQLGEAEIEEIAKRLARFDRDGAWTAATLAIIDRKPRVAASKLAAELGRETLPFKVDVRKLKKLGLTQSFEVGYEISPRGRAYVAARPAALKPAKPKRATRK